MTQSPGIRNARRHCPHSSGFTLIELLVVMAVFGLISAMVVSRFGGGDVFEELGFSQEVASAARYAQKLAVASRCPVRMSLTSATQFALNQPDSFAGGTCANNFSGPVTHPATRQAPYTGSAPGGVVMSVPGGFPATFIFDSQGGVTPSGDTVITIGSTTVTVLGDSGRVRVE